VKKGDFVAIPVAGVDLGRNFMSIINKPGRRSNPIPTKPDEEEEEEARPGKEDPKRKKKKRAYEVTC
jgi:hypothetical protein